MKEAVKVLSLGIGVVMLGVLVTTNNTEALGLPGSTGSGMFSQLLNRGRTSTGAGLTSQLFNGGGVGQLFNGGGMGQLFNRGGSGNTGYGNTGYGNTGYGSSPMGMMLPMMMMMMMMRGGGGYGNGYYGNNTGSQVQTVDNTQFDSQLSSLDSRISSIEETVYGDSEFSPSSETEPWLANLEQRVNRICLTLYDTGYTPPVSTPTGTTTTTNTNNGSGLFGGLLGNNRGISSGGLFGNGLFGGGLLGNNNNTGTTSTATDSNGNRNRVLTLERKVAQIENDLEDSSSTSAVQSLSVKGKRNAVIRLEYYDYENEQAELEVGTITHNFSYRPAEKTQKNLSLSIWYPISNGAVNPEAAPYPLIVFAHSQVQGNVPVLEDITAGIAKKGYIVCAVSHGRSTVQKDMVTTPIYLDTPGDVQAIVTEMLHLNNTPDSIFWGAIVEETVGIVGHAFGGQTAEVISGAALLGQKDYTDERIKAEVLLAPAGSIVAKDLAKIDIPTMLILGENDSTMLKANCKSAYANVQAAKYLAVIQKAKISDFANLGTEKENQAKIVSAVVEYTAALFDNVLKQDNDAEKTLEKKDASFLFYDYDVDGE